MQKIIHFLKTLLPLAFWVLIMFGFDSVSVTFMTLIAAFIHECGHILIMAIISKQKTNIPRPTINGLRLSPPRLFSYKEELFAALGGPCANIFFFIILIPEFKSGFGYVSTFGVINLMTGLSNLIPVSSFDGYKIAYNLIALRYGCERAETILSCFSFALSSVMVFLSLYLILKIGEGYWGFGIFFTIVLNEVFTRQKRAKTKNTRDF